MTTPASVHDAFATAYGAPPAGVWSAPGRVNLVGEHVDYNGGHVLPFALDRRTFVAAARRDDGLLVLSSAQRAQQDVCVPVDDLAPGSPGGWSAYALGIVWAAREAGHHIGGLSLRVDGTVPVGSGLSSSAALECAVALAVDDLFALGVDRPDLVLLAQRAENHFVGAPTGLMDQSAALLCTEGHALLLDARSRETEQVPLEVGGAGLALLVVDTRVSHDNADGGYAARRRDCEEAARELGVPTLRDVGTVGLAGALDQVATAARRRRVRHVVTEDARVLATVASLRRGDWPQVGALMDESHVSLRDDYEVSSPELDTAVVAARSAGALGARMTGSGFGGCAIALVPTAALGEVGRSVEKAFAAAGFNPPGLLPVTPSPGAARDS